MANTRTLRLLRCLPLLAAVLLLLPRLAGAAEPEAHDGTPPIGAHVKALPISAEAEWGKGLGLRLGELFSLQFRARAQLLAGVSFPTSDAVERGAAQRTTLDLAVRRFRLVLAGHAFTKKLRYYVQLGLAPRDMEADLLIPLRDAYVTYQPLRDLGIRAGQMKVPYGKQRVVSSSALQMVDRSTVTGAMNLDRDIGIYLLSEDFLGLGGRLQYQAGIFGGRGRNRGPNTDGVMWAARIQVNPLGSFDDLSEADFERRVIPRLSLGGSVAQNFNTSRQRSTLGDVYSFGRFTYLHAGADLHFKWRGLSVISEFFYRAADRPEAEDPAGSGKKEYARPALGYYAQAGFLFPLPFELVGRFGEVRPMDATDPAFHLEREAGGGLNFYFYEHSLKLQADYFYLFGDDPKAARHQLRLQAQLYF